MSAEIKSIRVKEMRGSSRDGKGNWTPSINPITVGELRSTLAMLGEEWDGAVLTIGTHRLKSLRFEVIES